MKVLKSYVDHMLGFPIILDEVFTVEISGHEVLLIDYESLGRKAMESLSEKAGRLAGIEIRFIRKFLKMTLAQFGQIFGVEHSAVKKWEMGKATMGWGTEVMLRLLAHQAVSNSSIDPLFDKLRQQQPQKATAAPLVVHNAEVNRNVTRLLDPVADRATIRAIKRRFVAQGATDTAGSKYPTSTGSAVVAEAPPKKELRQRHTLQSSS